MSERGVFAVDRGIWSDPDFAKEPFTEREAFLWLVSEAAWKPHRKRTDGKIIELDRGQLCHSVRFMADAWQWSKSRVDRYLNRLEDREMIARVHGTRTPTLTICNFDRFQRVALPDRDNSGTTAGQDRDDLRDKSGTTRAARNASQNNDLAQDANGAAGQHRDNENFSPSKKRDKLEDIETHNSPSLRSGESAPTRKARKPETEIDPNLRPDEIDFAYALSKGIPRNLVMDEWERFVNRNVAKGQKYRDWKAAWRTWCGSPYRKTSQAPPPIGRPQPTSKNPYVNDLLENMDPRHDTPDDGLSAAPHARSYGPRLVEYDCQVHEPSRGDPRPVPQILDYRANGTYRR